MATKKDTRLEAEDAEADGAARKQAVAKKSRSPLKLSRKLVLIAAAAVVVLGGAGGAYWHFGGHGSAQAALVTAVVKPPTFLDLPDVLVNLSSSGNGERTQYLKVKVTLELPDQAMSAQITPLMPRLMDAFQTYLRELRPIDLDGSAGLYRLKEELTRRVNAAIAPNRVNAVLFKEIVIQ